MSEEHTSQTYLMPPSVPRMAVFFFIKPMAGGYAESTSYIRVLAFIRARATVGTGEATEPTGARGDGKTMGLEATVVGLQTFKALATAVSGCRGGAEDGLVTWSCVAMRRWESLDRRSREARRKRRGFELWMRRRCSLRARCQSVHLRPWQCISVT
jgi:hypothetical protein